MTNLGPIDAVFTAPDASRADDSAAARMVLVLLDPPSRGAKSDGWTKVPAWWLRMGHPRSAVR